MCLCSRHRVEVFSCVEAVAVVCSCSPLEVLPFVPVLAVCFIAPAGSACLDLKLILDCPVLSKLQSSSCGNPGVPPKGILYGTRFNVGDKIRYSCVTGYVLDGHPQLTCVTNAGNAAVWDFPVPICRVDFNRDQRVEGPNCSFKELYTIPDEE
ncbi:CUB and sushi domain-containing protein 3 [Anabarilius grahami]|uniref:CUB and sushi domain-containing protein 3 n=1 Tax=Anabarilius grahami TaxID=495550 RepID=A0A3N0Z567_ANAGA|nr:CUB and sushi domain-containing protein 3 [Anabarilius grahami]